MIIEYLTVKLYCVQNNQKCQKTLYFYFFGYCSCTDTVSKEKKIKSKLYTFKTLHKPLNFEPLVTCQNQHYLSLLTKSFLQTKFDTFKFETVLPPASSRNTIHWGFYTRIHSYTFFIVRSNYAILFLHSRVSQHIWTLDVYVNVRVTSLSVKWRNADPSRRCNLRT